jgi:hypothetical protein
LFNNKNSAELNYSQFFTPNSYTTPLEGITRLFVITSGSTASASEMVINGLRPFREVITIGETTSGKPYAFRPREACGLTYSVVNIQLTNSQAFGDYASGFAPTCAVADDLSRPLGDAQEGRIATALAYINTGRCPATASANAQIQAKNSQNSRAPGTKPHSSAPKTGANDPRRDQHRDQHLDQLLGEDAQPVPSLPGAILPAR